MPFLLTAPTQPGTGNPPGSTAAWSSVDIDCVCIASGELTGFDVSTSAIVGIPVQLEAQDLYFISTRPTGGAYPVDGGGNPVVWSIGGNTGESQVRIFSSAIAAAPATVAFQVFRMLT